jgi:twitching motility protein PilT
MIIHSLLKDVVTLEGSDLHLVANTPAMVRVHGELRPINQKVYDSDEIKQLTYFLLSNEQQETFDKDHELDFAIYIENVGRFRANYYRTQGNIAAVFRVLPITMPSLEQLKAPVALFTEIAQKKHGLVLVTGATGSGKSTTLAAILNEINETYHKHIITIEDPVEFVHTNKLSVFSHRNVGSDTNSFVTALKFALRQDPDVILIGEMRDRETIEAAIRAAETGHLVFGTLHTNSAPSTVNRIVDVFEGSEQAQIRTQLASTLIAVIAQSLVPKVAGGRVGVYEVLLNNMAIGNLIRENKVHQIYAQMQLGRAHGMQTQTEALQNLVKTGQVSRDVALEHSNNPSELEKRL